jgi:predicted kinase
MTTGAYVARGIVAAGTWDIMSDRGILNHLAVAEVQEMEFLTLVAEHPEKLPTERCDERGDSYDESDQT